MIERELVFLRHSVNLSEVIEYERFLAAILFLPEDAQRLMRRLERRRVIGRGHECDGFVGESVSLSQAMAEFTINRHQRVKAFGFSIQIAQVVERPAEPILRRRLAVPIS